MSAFYSVTGQDSDRQGGRGGLGKFAILTSFSFSSFLSASPYLPLSSEDVTAAPPKCPAAGPATAYMATKYEQLQGWTGSLGDSPEPPKCPPPGGDSAGTFKREKSPYRPQFPYSRKERERGQFLAQKKPKINSALLIVKTIPFTQKPPVAEGREEVDEEVEEAAK